MQQTAREESPALAQQVRALQAALERAQAGDGCARRGCRLDGVTAAARAPARGEYDAQVVPWRDPEWNHPLVHGFRAKISEQARELDRLREENGLLRRWVSQHADDGRPGMAEA